MPSFENVDMTLSGGKKVKVEVDKILWEGKFATKKVYCYSTRKEVVVQDFFKNDLLKLIYDKMRGNPGTPAKIASKVRDGKVKFVFLQEKEFDEIDKHRMYHKHEEGTHINMFVKMEDNLAVFYCNVLPFGEDVDFRLWVINLRLFDQEQAVSEGEKAKAHEEAKAKALKEAHKKVAEEAAEKARAGAEAREAAYKKMREEEEAKAHKRLGEMYKEEQFKKANEKRLMYLEKKGKENTMQIMDEKILFLKGGGDQGPMKTPYNNALGARIVKCDKGLIFYPSLGLIEQLDDYKPEVYTLSQAVAGKLGKFKIFRELEEDEKRDKIVIDAYDAVLNHTKYHKPMTWEDFLNYHPGWGEITNRGCIEEYAEKLKTAK